MSLLVEERRDAASGCGYAARSVNPKISNRSEAQRRKNYIRPIAGSCFRVAGETFAFLPTIEELTVSDFTQRPCPATGGTLDVYLISVRIPRREWQEIDVGRLGLIEPEAALQRFDLRLQAERNDGCGKSSRMSGTWRCR